VRKTVIAWIVSVGLLGSAGRASDYDALCEGRKVDVRLGEAPSGKRVVLVDGKPQPLHWANLAGGDEDYRRAGFNTVFAELRWRGPEGEGKVPSVEEFFPDWDAMLLVIKRQGFFVNIYIHCNVHEALGGVPEVPNEEWRSAIQRIVQRYSKITNLVGWTFLDEYADVLSYSHEGFQDFLREEYGSVKRLNVVWGSDYERFEDVRLEYARNGLGRPEESVKQERFPFGIGPKAFDSARFKIERTARANNTFEEAVREVDPFTPIWSGANNLGWASAQIPTTWGAFFDFYPESSGNDMLTHHVWAMDIGRGPNARPAMQMVLPEQSVRFNWHLDSRVLRGWMVESAIHGAAGITVWPWSFLGKDNRAGDRSSSIERIDQVGMTIRQLEACGLFTMMPLPTIAVLYQPYAEGWGNVSQVYGVLRHPTGEPLPLFQELRFGTKFGQVEYLTNNTLSQARFDDYGVIIAQFSCDLTEEALLLLKEYVENGGVLLADAGFDCMRAGKTVTSMSDEAEKLFGIRSLKVSDPGPGEFVATGEYGDLLGGLVAGEDRTRRLRHFLLDVKTSTAKAALKGPGRQGLFVNEVGKGYAIFISGLAWRENTTIDPLLRKIHQALFKRRAKIELVGGEDWDSVSKHPWYAQGFEIALFGDGYILQNRSDYQENAPRGAQATSFTVRAQGTERQHVLFPRTVILVKEDEVIPLGTGQWPVEIGPVNGSD